MYVGGLNFIPSGTKEVNAYMNYFETETDKTTKVKTQKQIFSFNSKQINWASNENVYKKVLLPKPNGKANTLQIVYLANTSVFWNGFKLNFERMSLDQIAIFAYEPNDVVWWIAISGLALFACLAIVFGKNCFGFNCFMKDKFQQDEEDDEYVMA